tara:strand:- start:272 stop:604 length:333 start_codon:yes stop_codon:yes gene_type:complete
MKDNKLIAEFMRFPQQSDIVDDRTTAYYIGDVIKANNVNNKNEDNVFHPEDMMFHSSWDWLMPVVNKCFDTHFEHSDDVTFALNDALVTTNIHALYEAVLEFIKRTKKST